MKDTNKCVASLLCAALAVAGLAAPAAQAGSSDGTESDSANGTAQAKGLPMTKAVVTSSAIDSADDGSDALKSVAGVSSQAAKGAENSTVAIRGIALNPYSSYRLNGGLPIAGVITTPGEDKELVEALKGANGLMFGVSSPGGIVNLITKRATAVDVSRLALSANGFGQYGMAVDLGRKFGASRQFGVRLNLSAVHAENGVRGANGFGNFGSVALDWAASPDLTLEYDYEKYRRHVIEQANITPLTPVNGAIAVPRIPNPRLLASGPWDMYTPITQNQDLRANYLLSKTWSVMAEFGKSHSERSRIQARLVNYDVVSGEGSEKITLLHGQEYLNTFARTEVSGLFLTGPIAHALTLGISSSERFYNGASNSPSITVPQNIYHPVVIPTPKLSAAGQTFRPQDPKDLGLYVYDTIGIGRNWKVLAGMRHTRDVADNVNTPGGPHVISTSRVSTPALGVLYDLAPRTTVYASYMKGLEDGAQAPLQAVNAFEILASSVSSQKEIGIRTSYWKGIAASMAYFNLTQASANTSPVTGIFSTDGTNNFQGLESTLAVDLVPGWTLNAAGQVLNAVQNSVLDQHAFGKVPENTPRLSGNVSLEHRSSAVPGLRLNAGASYVGLRYIGFYDEGVVPGFTLFNVGAAYTTKMGQKKVAFQVAVDNLANKSYWNTARVTAYGAGMVRAIKFNAKVDL
jgi:iron complex outermembrane receptor protein